ncbi:MAG: ABC transporter ATP-binding protein [Terrimicrobiaceae bacterium]
MSRDEDQIAVRVKNVVKSFPSGDARTFALKGATLEARFGELLMIVGPSGCGKTTLLSVICGTLRCEEGEVQVFGHNIRTMKDSALTQFRCEKIGFIFQQFNLIPTLTAAENVSVPLVLNRVRLHEAEKRAGSMMAELGIGEKTRSFPNQLSGGQQQRVAISRALVHEPQLVICDEPTAALDAASGQKTLELLKSSALQPDRCVIVVTHDSRIYHFADRIAEMEDGRVTGIFEDPKDYHHA